jgi:hypothetical protein
MSHLQVHVSGELIKEVKKSAIDKEVTVKDFVEASLREKLERDKEAEGKESVNVTNLTN